MSHQEDKIKVLEVIGSKSAPCDIIDGDQEVFVSEKDFKKVGLSFDSAYILIKELFSENILSIAERDYSKKDGGTLLLRVKDIFDMATISIKYPETVPSEQEEIMQELGIYNEKTIPSKIPIAIDDKKGIYREDGSGESYEIKSGSKRIKLIKILGEKDGLSISKLEKELGQEKTLIFKEINQINEIFRKKLSVVDDLIIHIPTGGYSLNKERFDIKPIL